VEWVDLQASLKRVSALFEGVQRGERGRDAYLNVARTVHVGARACLELCRGGGDGEEGEDGGELHCAGYEGAGKATEYRLEDWRS
jgi:hypothetical protein